MLNCWPGLAPINTHCSVMGAGKAGPCDPFGVVGGSPVAAAPYMAITAGTCCGTAVPPVTFPAFELNVAGCCAKDGVTNRRAFASPSRLGLLITAQSGYPAPVPYNVWSGHMSPGATV